MTDAVAKSPSICLNMIVRDEAHIVHEVLDATAPYISSWVIVDTGSTDGTQDVIKNHMARRGIPGELHERPWQGFGHNRSEALALAQGHGDYIWVMDADDTLVGTLDFTGLTADIYMMQFQGDNSSSVDWWRAQLFRDGFPVRYEGVIHEHPVCDVSPVTERLEGNYRLIHRRLGGRHLDSNYRAHDRDLLLAAVERNPQDAHSVMQLALNYIEAGDFANAHKWLAQRAEMGGSDEEEVYLALFHLATAKEKLGATWRAFRGALLDAWEFRPIRAEPLYFIATRYRAEKRYRLGYEFAKLAAEIPRPEHDTRLIFEEIYAWRAVEEQVACAGGLGNYAEVFTLCRSLLARPAVPDGDRQRIAGNRDRCVPVMIEAAVRYPEALTQRLRPDRGEPHVLVSLVAGPDLDRTENALNSFLNCCADVSRVGRFLAVDAGLSPADRAVLQERYGFLEFSEHGVPNHPDEPGAHLTHIRAQIDARYWLHLGQGWRFFAPENLITRLIAILTAEPQVVQVGINFTDAVRLTGACAAEQTVRRAPDAGRYVLANALASGPAMFDTTRLDRAGGLQDTDPQPMAELGRRVAAAGLGTASLDEVLCIATSRYIAL